MKRQSLKKLPVEEPAAPHLFYNFMNCLTRIKILFAPEHDLAPLKLHY